MFFQLAEILPNQPTATWDLTKQLGVTHAVANVPLDSLGQPTPDFQALLWQKDRFRQAGIDLLVIETAFPWPTTPRSAGRTPRRRSRPAAS